MNTLDTKRYQWLQSSKQDGKFFAQWRAPPLSFFPTTPSQSTWTLAKASRWLRQALETTHSFSTQHWVGVYLLHFERPARERSQRRDTPPTYFAFCGTVGLQTHLAVWTPALFAPCMDA
jgi:hypothetical protein